VPVAILLNSLKKATRMHQIAPFYVYIGKKFSGEGHSPLPRPLPCGEGDTPSPHLTPFGAFGASTFGPLTYFSVIRSMLKTYLFSLSLDVV